MSDWLLGYDRLSTFGASGCCLPPTVFISESSSFRLESFFLTFDDFKEKMNASIGWDWIIN